MNLILWSQASPGDNYRSMIYQCRQRSHTPHSGGVNSHNPKYLAGGSSGGSAAALDYDDIDVTTGGDEAGSMRIPVSWCGVVELKPTHSLTPYTGMVGTDQTFDHVGPMGRCVADVSQVLEVIAGKDPLDPRQYEVPVQAYAAALGPDLDGVRIGVLREGFSGPGAEPNVDAAVRAALNQLAAHGARVTEVSVPAHLTARALHRGLVAEGLPVELMLVGRHVDDAGLLAIAHAIEQQIDWPPGAAQQV